MSTKGKNVSNSLWMVASELCTIVEYYCKNSYDMVWVWVRWVSVQYCRFRTRKLSNMEMKNANFAVLTIPFEAAKRRIEQKV